MAKAKKKGMYIIGALIIIAVTVLACYFIFHKKPDNGLKFDDNATTGVLPGIDIDQRRKQLQEEVDRGMIAFTINTSPVFLNGSSQGNLLIENPQNNAKLLQVSIVADDTQEEIYASDYLKPGTYIENAKLDKVLEKGSYKATAYFSAYDEKTEEYIGRTGAQITITVQN